MLARGVDVPRDRLAEAQRSRGRGDQRSIANRARRHQGLATHLHCLFEITFVQPVYRELDFEDCSFRGRPVGELLPRMGQAAMGVVVPAQPVLDGGALSRQLDPLRDGAIREELERVEEGRPAAIELSQRAERGGERDAHVELARIPRRQESQGRLEPPRRRGRCSRSGGRPGFEEDGDGLLVALSRALFQVVGLLGRCRAASDERCGCPAMGAEPPAGRCCFVHCAPHERVTEDESARHGRLAHEIDREQGVECPQAVGQGQLGDRRCKVGLEGLACDCRPLEQHSFLRRE